MKIKYYEWLNNVYFGIPIDDDNNEYNIWIQKLNNNYGFIGSDKNYKIVHNTKNSIEIIKKDMKLIKKLLNIFFSEKPPYKKEVIQEIDHLCHIVFDKYLEKKR
ncbi:MAG: hypothetical protein QXD48_00200 [Candidatus Aenigmatarchaeota archaeon]